MDIETPALFYLLLLRRAGGQPFHQVGGICSALRERGSGRQTTAVSSYRSSPAPHRPDASLVVFLLAHKQGPHVPCGSASSAASCSRLRASERGERERERGGGRVLCWRPCSLSRSRAGWGGPSFLLFRQFHTHSSRITESRPVRRGREKPETSFRSNSSLT